MFKRLALAAVLTLLILGAITLAIPSVRETLWGVRLTYRFAPEPEQVGWILTVAQSQEVRGKTETRPVQLGDSRKLQAALTEKVESRGSEVVIGYELGETRTEQMDGTPGARNLAGTRIQARVLPGGGVAASQAFAHPESTFFGETSLQSFFASVWPPLPPGYSHAGRPAWMASYSMEIKDRLLDQPVRLDHKLTYTLERFFEDQGLRLAEIKWAGSVEVTNAKGKGEVKGSCFYDLDHNRCVTGVYQVEQEFTADLKTLPGHMPLAWHQAQHGQFVRLQSGQAGTPTPQG